MSKEKYSLFILEGGLGKHVAATAVARCIKNNHPDRKLIVVCAWPEVFINLEFVDKVYRVGNTPYFYQTYIKDVDSLIFKHEPYYTTEHIHKTLPLIENWCKLYQLEYNGEQPTIEFNRVQLNFAQNGWPAPEKPVLLIQSAGGVFQKENDPPYKWTRDMPVHLLEQIHRRFADKYTIFQVTKPNGYTINGATIINQPLSNMQLFTVLLRSTKRLFIDSVLQHAAAALKLPSTVLWIGTSPKVFGYDLHTNITATPKPDFKLPDSFLFDFNFEGLEHECPYKDPTEMFNFDEIVEAIEGPAPVKSTTSKPTVNIPHGEPFIKKD